MKTGKLRNKILAFALSLTLVPFILTALAVYYFVVRSYQSQIEDEQNKLLAKAVVDIRREQESARRDVALIANLPVIAEYLKAVSSENQSVRDDIQAGETTARAHLQLRECGDGASIHFFTGVPEPLWPALIIRRQEAGAGRKFRVQPSGCAFVAGKLSLEL